MAQPTGFELAFDLLLAQLKLGTGGPTRYRRAAAAAKAAIGPTGLVFETGMEQAGMAGDTGLRARLLARRVDAVRLSPSASASDLLRLAQALSSDDAPLPQDARVHCEMVVDIFPETNLRLTRLPGEDDDEFQRTGRDDDDSSREPRSRTAVSDEIQRLRAALDQAIAGRNWIDTLHAAQAFTRLIERVSERDRGSLSIFIKRLLTAPVVRGLLDYALRMPEEQARLAAVLRHGGREALEVVADAVSETEAVGPKRFLLGVLADAPDAFPLLEGLARSHRAHAAKLGAEVLAETGNPAAVAILKPLAGHTDAAVRAAALRGLGAFPKSGAMDTLRAGLADPVPGVRVAAAGALAAWGSGGAVMPILSALEGERDGGARLGYVQALATIDAPEAATALATIALEKRSMLTRRGYTEEQRLAAVEGLAKGTTRAAQAALERVAGEADGAVRDAARTASGGAASPG